MLCGPAALSQNTGHLCFSVLAIGPSCPQGPPFITVVGSPRGWQQGAFLRAAGPPSLPSSSPTAPAPACWPLLGSCADPRWSLSMWRLPSPPARDSALLDQPRTRTEWFLLGASQVPGLSSPCPPRLFSRRYYKETSGLMLDVGPYMKALEVPARVRPTLFRSQGLPGCPGLPGEDGVLSIPSAFMFSKSHIVFAASSPALRLLWSLAPQLRWSSPCSLSLPPCPTPGTPALHPGPLPRWPSRHALRLSSGFLAPGSLHTCLVPQPAFLQLLRLLCAAWTPSQSPPPVSRAGLSWAPRPGQPRVTAAMEDLRQSWGRGEGKGGEAGMQRNIPDALTPRRSEVLEVGGRLTLGQVAEAWWRVPPAPWAAWL